MEMSNTQIDQTPGGSDPEVNNNLVALEVAGFTQAEATRLLATRARVAEGSINEWTADFKRLRFAKWLYEQGRLES